MMFGLKALNVNNVQKVVHKLAQIVTPGRGTKVAANNEEGRPGFVGVKVYENDASQARLKGSKFKYEGMSLFHLFSSSFFSHSYRLKHHSRDEESSDEDDHKDSEDLHDPLTT